MSKLDFDTVVRQEESYLRLVHPTPDDIPGCISLFDTYLSCNGTLPVKIFNFYANASHIQLFVHK
jgi:hypothetical protein